MLEAPFHSESFLYRLARSQLFTNPINFVLLCLLLYKALPLLLPSSTAPIKTKDAPSSWKTSYSYLPTPPADAVVWRKYTPKTLVEFDGRGKTGRILLAINGKVFDVTAGANFYGPDGPYGNFAGHDASRGMAKQSFDMDMLTPIDQPIDKLEDLTQAEISNMLEWQAHFTGKYIVCGELVNNDEA